MGESASLSDFQGDGSQNVMIATYRHDVHKLNGEAHDYAPDTFRSAPVNQTVPHGADGDASALSHPNGNPDNHDTHYRLSLPTGEAHYDPGEFSRPRLSESVSDLLTGPDPETTYRGSCWT